MRQNHIVKLKMRMIFFLILTFCLSAVHAQNDLDYYLKKAEDNSASLNEIQNQYRINELQRELEEANNSAFQVSLTSNYLFSPYFNNNGDIITANPGPDAIGYDVGITNGGLYSALVNVEKNIFNGGITNAVETQINIQQKQNKYNYDLERRNLQKQITDQYLTAYKSLITFRLTKQILQNIDDQLKITGDLVAKGYEKTQNYLLLKIEYHSQQIALTENFQQYKNDLMQLNSLCGIKDTGTVFIDSVLITMHDAKAGFSFTEKYKLDSLATVSRQQMFETKYQPQVKLFFNTGLNAVELDGIQRKFGLSAGVDFQLPIFDGGQKDITRQQNEISLSSINNFRNNALTNIDNQKQNSASNIRLLRNNISSIDSLLDQYNELIKLSDKQLQTGDITMIEYLNILQNYITLKKTKIEKEVNLQMEINNYNYWNE